MSDYRAQGDIRLGGGTYGVMGRMLDKVDVDDRALDVVIVVIITCFCGFGETHTKK